jgi:hypothetical protein
VIIGGLFAKISYTKRLEQLRTNYTVKNSRKRSKNYTPFFTVKKDLKWMSGRLIEPQSKKRLVSPNHNEYLMAIWQQIGTRFGHFAKRYSFHFSISLNTPLCTTL